ncbi:MAG TPA: FIST N-terminal domain-containing protein [Methanocella sp.]|nr:FIST N-terminal domain-containing protein [Methanocella sp.]
MGKLNCWEYMKCGREQGGEKAFDLGVCPASMVTMLDGVNGGKNGGRACWAIAGTFCNGKAQGVFAMKRSDCESCAFYRTVHDEEGPNLKTMASSEMHEQLYYDWSRACPQADDNTTRRDWPDIKLKTAHSIKDSIDEIVIDIRNQLDGFDAKAIIFFASPHFDTSISRKMQEAFSNATVFGCTTAGEISSGKMLKGSVVAMALGSGAISSVKAAVVEDMQNGVYVVPAFQAFEKHFRMPVSQMDPGQHVGLVLIDGLSGKEEEIMSQIGVQTGITFVGGSAGDDLRFKETFVYANGKAYTNAALLVLFRMKSSFEVVKTQSLKVLDRRMMVTKADETRREVVEFDGKPAAVAYAEVLGVPVAEAQKHFMHNPVGIAIDDDPYVRSPQRLNGQNIVFYCNILEGTDVSLLESTDINEDMKSTLTRLGQAGPIAGIINFHCILRTMELEQKDQTKAYCELFKSIPTIGFSTYGEQYIGHINQTSTMLVFR